DIIIFGRDDQKKSGGLGAAAPGVLGGVFGSKKDNKAVVAIVYSLIDAETREVVLSDQSRGESKREDKNIFAGILTAKGGGAGGYDMTSSNFGQTILGEATNDCVTKLASTITDKTGTMPTKFLNIEARVAAVSGSTVTINAGSDAGVQVGDKFEISKVVREIK